MHCDRLCIDLTLSKVETKMNSIFTLRGLVPFVVIYLAIFDNILANSKEHFTCIINNFYSKYSFILLCINFVITYGNITN